ncbi:sulfite exporter TauE/SafE family protein [Salinisphaera sp. Q1T1-3]|uniref:sulfite exporter TauE/SafE family protein n=1 Tax=Salinisphaera sp. Q1T1-3 TaxID=2321229 RepID=UPI000E74F480|nr:sulfite exporter TauE/SafE family protein [Salinisphaera sp. Q1T1-3]RJS95005.1 sulfite exporter TauE/SafE family protein [Salinisphaera sp. Q1T1-3]
MFSFSIAGLVVGAAVGLTGVGGGSLMTPLLILLFGFAPSAAVGTDLLYAAGTKAFGTWLHGRQQTVDWRVVGLMASGSIPAAILTVAMLHHVGITPAVQEMMVLVLAFAMVLTAILTFVRRPLVAWLHKRMVFASADRQRLLKLRPAITVAGGVALGVLVSLSSVGAGVLGTTMLLILYPNTRAVRIVGTDIAHAVPLTLIAGLGHLTLGTTDIPVLFMLLLGSIPGIYIGTRLASRMPDGALRPIIAVLLFGIAVSMIFKTMHL